jgi:hypothetical protein
MDCWNEWEIESINTEIVFVRFYLILENVISYWRKYEYNFEWKY